MKKRYVNPSLKMYKITYSTRILQLSISDNVADNESDQLSKDRVDEYEEFSYSWGRSYNE